MPRLNERQWHPFAIGDLFEVSRPVSRTKNQYSSGSVPFIASGSSNNGTAALCQPKNGEKLNKGNCITVSPVDGSAFYQPYDFLGRGGGGSSIIILRKDDLDQYTGLFISRMITNTCSNKYAYGHMGNSDNIKHEQIMLPINDSASPDYQFMHAYCKKVMSKQVDYFRKYSITNLRKLGKPKALLPLNQKKWSEFPLNEIFDIRSGKRLENRNKIPGQHPFIGASDSNNGVTGFIDNINESIDHNVLGVNYNGTPCMAFYHPYRCLFSDDVKRLHLLVHKDGIDNCFVYLFFAALIKQQRSKYGYGYKFNERRMLRQKLIVPVTDTGNPDYGYMKQYILNLTLKKYEEFLNIFDSQFVPTDNPQ